MDGNHPRRTRNQHRQLLRPVTPETIQPRAKDSLEALLFGDTRATAARFVKLRCSNPIWCAVPLNSAEEPVLLRPFQSARRGAATLNRGNRPSRSRSQRQPLRGLLCECGVAFRQSVVAHGGAVRDNDGRSRNRITIFFRKSSAPPKEAITGYDSEFEAISTQHDATAQAHCLFSGSTGSSQIVTGPPNLAGSTCVWSPAARLRLDQSLTVDSRIC